MTLQIVLILTLTKSKWLRTTCEENESQSSDDVAETENGEDVSEEIEDNREDEEREDDTDNDGAEYSDSQDTSYDGYSIKTDNWRVQGKDLWVFICWEVEEGLKISKLLIKISFNNCSIWQFNAFSLLLVK